MKWTTPFETDPYPGLIFGGCHPKVDFFEPHPLYPPTKKPFLLTLWLKMDLLADLGGGVHCTTCTPCYGSDLKSTLPCWNFTTTLTWGSMIFKWISLLDKLKLTSLLRNTVVQCNTEGVHILCGKVSSRLIHLILILPV